MADCQTLQIFDLVGKKWTFVILQEITLHKHAGFNVLLKRIGAITPKILSQRLQQLEEQGILHKDVSGGKIKMTHYILTTKGQELKNILDTLRRWNSMYTDNQVDCTIQECAACKIFLA